MTQTIPAAGPSDSPGFLLWRVTLRWQRTMTRALAPLHLTHTQFVLLAAVWWLSSEGRLPSEQQLARLAGTDVATTGAELDELAARELLVRSSDPIDPDDPVFGITGAGSALAERSILVVEAADQEFFEPVEETPEFGAALYRLAGH